MHFGRRAYIIGSWTGYSGGNVPGPETRNVWEVCFIMAKTAFVGGLLIDGTGAQPVQDALVLVDGKKILYAGPKKEYGPDYETRDITGKTIMPGLIDTHLHFPAT